MKKDYVTNDQLDLKKLCAKIDAMSEEEVTQYIKEYEEKRSSKKE